MNNERLRRQMLWFVAVFVVVGIVVIYLRNAQVQKTGARQGWFESPGDWQTEMYDDGKIKAQGAMKNGYLKEGEWTNYREDGSIESKEVYRDGIVQSIKEDSIK